jgi:hypothetical protein
VAFRQELEPIRNSSGTLHLQNPCQIGGTSWMCPTPVQTVPHITDKGPFQRRIRLAYCTTISVFVLYTFQSLPSSPNPSLRPTTDSRPTVRLPAPTRKLCQVRGRLSTLSHSLTSDPSSPTQAGANAKYIHSAGSYFTFLARACDSPNRPWSPVSVFPVRYDHHLHIKSNAIPVTGLGGPYACFL